MTGTGRNRQYVNLPRTRTNNQTFGFNNKPIQVNEHINLIHQDGIVLPSEKIKQEKYNLFDYNAYRLLGPQLYSFILSINIFGGTKKSQLEKQIKGLEQWGEKR